MGTQVFWRMRTTCSGVPGPDPVRGTGRGRPAGGAGPGGGRGACAKKGSAQSSWVWHMVRCELHSSGNRLVVKCNDGKP